MGGSPSRKKFGEAGINWVASRPRPKGGRFNAPTDANKAPTGTTEKLPLDINAQSPANKAPAETVDRLPFDIVKPDPSKSSVMAGGTPNAVNLPVQGPKMPTTPVEQQMLNATPVQGGQITGAPAPNPSGAINASAPVAGPNPPQTAYGIALAKAQAAANSGAGAGTAPGVGAQQQNAAAAAAAQQANQTSSGTNQFLAPSLNGIKFGGS